MSPSTDVAPKPSLWSLAWDWILDHILRPIFTPIAHALGASKGAGTVAGLILIGLALAGLVFVIFRLVLAFAPRDRRAGSASNVRALEASGSFTDWFALAREAAARGDFRRAIGALFSSALAALDDSSVVAFDPSRTPGEYRRLVRRAASEASPPFDDLTDRFVRAAYAKAAPERADFEAAERALSTFEPLVRS